MVFEMYPGEKGNARSREVPMKRHGLWEGLGEFQGMWCRGGILLRGLGVGAGGRYGGSVFGLGRGLLGLWGRRWGHILKRRR